MSFIVCNTISTFSSELGVENDCQISLSHKVDAILSKDFSSFSFIVSKMVFRIIADHLYEHVFLHFN